MKWLAILNRVLMLTVWCILFIPTFGSFNGKWLAFSTRANSEVECSKGICKQNPEWKETRLYQARDKNLSGPIPIIRNLKPLLCVRISGTGASSIQSFKYAIISENQPFEFENQSTIDDDCVSFPTTREISNILILEIRHNEETEIEIKKILKESAKIKGYSGTHDELLEKFSFEIIAEYQIDWIGLILMYFISIITGYLAIELFTKTIIWLVTGIHKK